MRWCVGLGLLAGCATTGPGPAHAQRNAIFQPAAVAPPAAAAAAAVLVRDGRVVPARDAGADPRVWQEGAPISLDLVDADLHDALRLLGAVAGVDFVVTDAVQARVTLRLEAVPWNHALAALLHREGLAVAVLPGGAFGVVRAAAGSPMGPRTQP